MKQDRKANLKTDQKAEKKTGKKTREKAVRKLHFETLQIETFSDRSGQFTQKMEYLKLPTDFKVKFLEEDVQNGAKIYERMSKELEEENKSSVVNIIRASVKEEGLRAIALLAGIHAVKDGYRFNDTDMTESGKETVNQNAEDAEYFADTEDDLFEEVLSYTEYFYQIPLIKMEEAKSYIFNNNQDDFTGNMFGMQFMSAKRPFHPLWEECQTEAVCIIYESDKGFMNENTLTEMEWEVIRLFSGNRRVYLLMLSNRPEDLSVQKTLVEFTANLYHVEDEEEKKLTYYEIMLKSIASRYHFSFDPALNLREITEKLITIDRDFPCRGFEKTFRYLDHIKASKILKEEDFQPIGLFFASDMAAGKGTDTDDIQYSLYGMQDVKRQVAQFLNMLEYQKLLKEKGIKNNRFHSSLLFIGPPGTAKTTVAKYLGNECVKRGLLMGDNFISLSGAQLKGAFVGTTAPKVHQIFAENDIIFIDEAYSLSEDNNGENDSYSKEALAQIAIELEEHSRDKLIIFAGYGGRTLSYKDNKMLHFLQANPGISSRIGSTIYFERYDADQMVEIVHRLANLDALELSGEFDGMMKSYFENRCLNADFGNGREARVLLEQCKMQLANRVMGTGNPTEKELKTIQKKDVEGAIRELEYGNLERMGKSIRRTGII